MGAATEMLKGRGEPREGDVGPLMVSGSGERVKFGGSVVLSFMVHYMEDCLSFIRKVLRKTSIGGGCERRRLALVSTEYLLEKVTSPEQGTSGIPAVGS